MTNERQSPLCSYSLNYRQLKFRESYARHRSSACKQPNILLWTEAEAGVLVRSVNAQDGRCAGAFEKDVISRLLKYVDIGKLSLNDVAIYIEKPQRLFAGKCIPAVVA